jgi:hypothetical protein
MARPAVVPTGYRSVWLLPAALVLATDKNTFIVNTKNVNFYFYITYMGYSTDRTIWAPESGLRLSKYTSVIPTIVAISP